MPSSYSLRLLLAALIVIPGLPATSNHPVNHEASSLFVNPQAATPAPIYETRTNHDPNGTGKFYMGREIAQVMGPGGIPWLDRAERDTEEKPAVVIDALKLHGGEVVADLGAGSGYFTFRIAPKVGATGKVLAVEIQDEMIATLRQRAKEQKASNVEVIKGTERDPHLS